MILPVTTHGQSCPHNPGTTHKADVTDPIHVGAEASFSSGQNAFDIPPLGTPLLPIPRYPRSRLHNRPTLARVKNRTGPIFLIYKNQKDKKKNYQNQIKNVS